MSLQSISCFVPLYLTFLTLMVGGCAEPSTTVTDAGVIADATLSDDDAIATDAAPGEDGGADGSLIPADYICPEGVTTITYPGVSEPFAKPERPGGKPVTKQDVLDYFGTIPQSGSYLSAAPALRPGNEHLYSLFASRGENITLYYANFFVRSSYEDRFLSMVVLVDYEPVEATYIVWNDDRTEKRLEFTGTGLHFPLDSNLALVDVVVPAAAFPEDRRYDLGLFAKSSGAPSGAESSYERIAVYYNGFGGFERPCMAPVELGPTDAFEQALIGKTGFTMVIAHHADVVDPDRVFDPIHVSPGETIPLMLRWIPLGSDSISHLNRAFVPLMDGTPVGDPFFLSTPTTHEYLTPYRMRMTVTAPTEPGVHEFLLASFWDPFLPPEDHTGAEVEGIWGSSSRVGSSTVTLIVEEPAP